MPQPYDIIIGSGPGDATAPHGLAPTGKHTPLIERGNYPPRSPANWDPQTVFVDGAYQLYEAWHGKKGESFHPGPRYYVGGNSKVYCAALVRMREREFGEVLHRDGVLPAWLLNQEIFGPCCGEATRLFHVHGQRDEAPGEPPASGPRPYPPVSREPLIQAPNDRPIGDGRHPFHPPPGILPDEKGGKVTPTSAGIRCDAFDGFPRLPNGEADAQVMCVDPSLRLLPNLTPPTNAYVSRLETDAAGTSVTDVAMTSATREEHYTANIVVVARGALSSALLLISRNEKHPRGLANGSGQVGRNCMRHNQSILVVPMRVPNHTVFQKTLAPSDLHFGSDDWEYPLGLIRMCATSHGAQIRGEALLAWLEWMPRIPFEQTARRSMDFWPSREDSPRAGNRIRCDGDRVVPEITEDGMEAHHQLKKKLERIPHTAGAHPISPERSLYPGKGIPIGGTARQAGTARFGTVPAGSVPDIDRKAREVDNPNVADVGFLPSIGAVNPRLTIIANALRVADQIRERLE